MHHGRAPHVSPSSTFLPGGEELDRLVDILAQIVRIYGAEAIDLESSPAEATRALCDRWAEHLTLLRPPPRATAPDRPGRDLVGLRDFFADHRRRERRLVRADVGDLKDVVWSFVQSLGRALPEDESDDALATEQLARLREAVESSSIARLKQEAARTVGTLGELITRRQLRDRARAEELERVVQSLGRKLEVANREGTLDPLTRLFNRRGLDDHMQRTIEMFRLSESPACLLLVDADRFKMVNDLHGHAAGDATLVALANCLVRSFPRNADCVARFGGEEFAIVLRECWLADGQRLAERARAAVRRLEIPAGPDTIRLSVSIGVAELGRDETAESWVERADVALYQAKQGGRDRVVTAGPR